MLGISLYPDKTTIEQDMAYLDVAQSLGYRRVFTSMLQVDPKNPSQSVRRIRESCQAAVARDMLVTIDIHPLVFKFIGCEPTDLSYFHEMGISTVRMDAVVDGRTEASMTHNPYGIGIELNMSNNNPMLDLVRSFGPDTKLLSGSCNFYPQRYTGMSLEGFRAAAQRYRENGLNTAVFITSQEARVSPWPVCEGACTLEIHRDLPLREQARHLQMLALADDWIIGNAFAGKTELADVAEEYGRRTATLSIEIDPQATQFERSLILEHAQRYRGDASEYMIRSCAGRALYTDKRLPAHLNRPIHMGDILVLNEAYGQYKAEVQIALRERPADNRVNVVGRVVPRELSLIQLLSPCQEFRFEEVYEHAQ